MTTSVATLLLALQVAGTTIVPAKTAEVQPVEIVLYSDFQCPFCAQFSQPFRDLQTKGVDGLKTKVIFKHFPLSMHPNAQLAHQAAVAAGQQGKFWEMHDLLFAHRDRVQRADLLAYAKQLSLDLKRFERDIDSQATKKLIDDDEAEGEKRGVSGTPTFYVNGKEFVGAMSYDQLRQIVQREHWRGIAGAEITDAMMSEGPQTAPVTVELFADLQSPITRQTLDALTELRRRFPDDVRLQFRSFPLAFHPQAALAHEAAVTAGKDGHFWEFADFALERQNGLREQDLIALAGRLGLDAKTFAESLQQHRYAVRVDADLEEGRTRGIRGSPTIVIDAQRVDGVPKLETLIDYVQRALAGRQTSAATRP